MEVLGGSIGGCAAMASCAVRAGWVVVGFVRVWTMVQVAAAAMLKSCSAWSAALMRTVLGGCAVGLFDAWVRGCVRCGARGWCG